MRREAVSGCSRPLYFYGGCGCVLFYHDPEENGIHVPCNPMSCETLPLTEKKDRFILNCLREGEKLQGEQWGGTRGRSNDLTDDEKQNMPKVTKELIGRVA